MWQFYLKTVAETSFRFNWICFRLVYLYETLVPKMSEAFKEREWDSVTFKQLLKRKLHKAQGCLLKAFRQILFTTYLRPILEDGWETEHFVNKKTVLGKYIFVLQWEFSMYLLNYCLIFSMPAHLNGRVAVDTGKPGK